MNIDQHEQLFLDDALIAKTENIIRRINQAEKQDQPLIRADRPWENMKTCIFGSVLYDRNDKIFKMWYFSNVDTAYAVSKDGISWEKPELDVIIRNGKKTNLVLERGVEYQEGKRGRFGYFYENFNVIRDEQETNPDRRYKTGFVAIEFKYTGRHMTPWHEGERRGLGTAVSPDGIHWQVENDFASHEICDISHFMQDDAIKRYVLYGRTKLTPEKNDGRWRAHGWARAVNRIESQDFREWSKGELVMAADEKDPDGAEIYSLSVFPYEGIYIGFVQMYYGWPTQGNLHIQLAVSRDGRKFTRVEPRDPFIPEGEIGAWDRFNISMADTPVETGNEIRFYYSGRTYRHPPYEGQDDGPVSISIGLAKIKRGRFVSLEASFDGGMIETKPLIFKGQQLRINANADYGVIRVSLYGDNDIKISDHPAEVHGHDDVAIPVVFDGCDLRKLAGKPARIRFELKNAKLFGFRFQ